MRLLIKYCLDFRFHGTGSYVIASRLLESFQLHTGTVDVHNFDDKIRYSIAVRLGTENEFGFETEQTEFALLQNACLNFSSPNLIAIGEILLMR